MMRVLHVLTGYWLTWWLVIIPVIVYWRHGSVIEFLMNEPDDLGLIIVMALVPVPAYLWAMAYNERESTGDTPCDT